MSTNVAGGYATLEIDGACFEYLFVPGESSAAPLVLLHEGLGCVALWRDFPRVLAARTGRAVFAYSRAGYGGSSAVALPRPLDYMTREAIEVLPLILRRMAFAEYVLLGHSDGASIALVYAGRHRDPRLQALIVMAPHIFAENLGITAIEAVRRNYERGDLRARLEKYHRDNVDCAFYGWCNSWTNPEFRHWSIEADLAAIDRPLLQLQGVDDEYGSAAQLERIEAAVAGPVTTHWLENCGHAPHLQYSEKTVDAIASFLA